MSEDRVTDPQWEINARLSAEQEAEDLRARVSDLERRVDALERPNVRYRSSPE